MTVTDSAMVVLCTAPTEEEGARLARGLLETRLAACVNLVPAVRSFYVWEGKQQEDREVQLVIKTRPQKLSELTAWITEHHSYDVPEVLALPVAGGSRAYLDWLRDHTR